MDSGGWYLVDPTSGQPVGPYDVRSLQGMISSGHVRLETPLWREDQPEWAPLKDIPELRLVAQVARDLLKVAAKGSGKGDLDELDLFKQEISALEAAGEEGEPGSEGGAGGGPGAGGGGGPATPEELEFEDDDGTTYVWDHKLRKYMPKQGEGAAEYGQEDMVFQGDEEQLPSLDEAKQAQAAAAAAGADSKAQAAAAAAGNARKRPAEEGGGGGAAAGAPGAGADDGNGNNNKKGGKGKGNKKGKGGGQQQQPQQAGGEGGWVEIKHNTSVYINGLPDDVTVEELHEACSKYGLIKEDEHKQPRIKLYRDKATGDLKGDALVIFLKEPSVHLAVSLMDGTQLRPGQPNCPTMQVQPAKFEKKEGDQYQQPKGGGGGKGAQGGGGGGGGSAANKKARKALLERQERLLGWGGFDDKLPAEKVTVVLRGMFRPAELAAELGGATELEAEVQQEASTLGPVEKVRVFKQHPEGVVTVKFKQAEHAAACVAKMHGRFFAGQRIVAGMWDGVTNFAAAKVQETPEEEEARLEAYARELEAKAAAKAAAEAAAAEAAPAGDA